MPVAVMKATGDQTERTIRNTSAPKLVGKTIMAIGIQAVAGMTLMIFTLGKIQ